MHIDLVCRIHIFTSSFYMFNTRASNVSCLKRLIFSVFQLQNNICYLGYQRSHFLLSIRPLKQDDLHVRILSGRVLYAEDTNVSKHKHYCFRSCTGNFISESSSISWCFSGYCPALTQGQGTNSSCTSSLVLSGPSNVWFCCLPSFNQLIFH